MKLAQPTPTYPYQSPGLVCLAEARKVEGDGAGEAADLRQQAVPVARRAGASVNKNDGFVALAGSRLENARAQSERPQLPGPDGGREHLRVVSTRLAQLTNPARRASRKPPRVTKPEAIP
jgi:hypothetical protein